MQYVGIDWAYRRAAWCALSDGGAISGEGMVPADEDGLARLVLTVGPEIRACVEMMSGAVWVRDRLAAAGWDVAVMPFARNDATPLPGFDENSFVDNAGFGSRSLADLAEEFEHTRKSNLYLFKSLDGDSSLRLGSASDNKISVRAIAYIIAGHESHHVGILRSRYL